MTKNDDDDQLELDMAKSIREKDRVLDHMSMAHKEWLEIARGVAVDIMLEKGDATADDVRFVMYAAKMFPRHHNAWGAVFRDKRFVWTGEYRRSAVPDHKGNMQRVWRLK